MISVAVKGYGIVIWDADGEWRTYTASDQLSALLATRVEIALHEHGAVATDDDACQALLTINGAHLLAVDCDHGPGGCEGEIGHN